MKNFSVLKGCVVSVKLSSSNWCFSISPELETLVFPDEEAISPETIVVNALKIESLLLDKQYLRFFTP